MKHWPRWEVIAQGLRGSVSWGNYTTWDISLWWADRDAQDEPTLATGNICVLNVESSILTHCLVSSGSYLPSMKSDVNTVTGALCFTAQPTSHILCGPGAILSEWLPSFLCSWFPYEAAGQVDKSWRTIYQPSLRHLEVFTSFQLGADCSRGSPPPPLPPWPTCFQSIQLDVDFAIRAGALGKTVTR